MAWGPLLSRRGGRLCSCPGASSGSQGTLFSFVPHSPTHPFTADGVMSFIHSFIHSFIRVLNRGQRVGLADGSKSDLVAEFL